MLSSLAACTPLVHRALCVRCERDIRHPRGEEGPARAHEGVARGAWRRRADARSRGRSAARARLPPAAAAKSGIVSGFSPIADEFRVWPLLRRLAGAGYRLALPVMQGKAKPLLFRAWAPGDEMDRAVWGIAEPKPDKPAVEPDILIVPLLAFDRAGYRLGYGGGFYDRTLAGLRAHKADRRRRPRLRRAGGRRRAASRL